MAKSSFAKPGAAKPAAAASKPTPGKPAPAAKPAPARPAAASPAKATPPAKAAPAPRGASPAPAKPRPAAAPAGITTNAGHRGPVQRHEPPTAVNPPPEPTPAPREEVHEVESEVVESRALANASEAPQTANNLMAVPLGASSGDMSQADYSLPKLQLAQFVGDLSQQLGFTPGDLVLNQTTILWQEGCDGVEVTFLRYVKQFVENLPFDSEEFPRIFNTLAEATEAGLSTEWGPNGEKPDVLPQCVAMVIIKKPEGVEDPTEFTLEINGELYALAMWRISGVAYQLMKTITSAQRTRLREGLHTGSFLVSARKVTGKNVYFVPVLQPGQMHSQETLADIVEKCS